MKKKTESAVSGERDPESFQFIVNKKHPIPEGWVPSDLVEPKNVDMAFSDSVLRRAAAEALSGMFARAAQDGIHLYLGSMYRSYEGQASLYARWCRESGKKQADRYSARPGYSEHHTGLAADMRHLDPEISLELKYADTPDYAWLRANAADFGFVLRYPKGKEAVTGFDYEPWHFRFIGREEAIRIRALGEDMTLEEYYGVEGGDYDS